VCQWAQPCTLVLLSLALPDEAVVSRNVQGDWVVLVPWMDRHTVLNRLELSFGRPVQLQFGPRSLEMFVALTPCAVVSRGSGDTVELMHARARWTSRAHAQR
jgi:hypothetical protein